ncbi:unnamed protein product [Prorocentrum cordatum]|uniref:Centrosomal protein of 19 kDa n=1 Tax=Prorocentrum cordatum TaxID=2364126 RepID=A0ABN9PPK6_9DINO|nr:unnamed protein product [Polarella glacialis]
MRRASRTGDPELLAKAKLYDKRMRVTQDEIQDALNRVALKEHEEARSTHARSMSEKVAALKGIALPTAEEAQAMSITQLRNALWNAGLPAVGLPSAPEAARLGELRARAAAPMPPAGRSNTRGLRFPHDVQGSAASEAGGSEKAKAFAEGGGTSPKPSRFLKTCQKAGGIPSLLRRPAFSHFPPFACHRKEDPTASGVPRRREELGAPWARGNFSNPRCRAAVGGKV